MFTWQLIARSILVIPDEFYAKITLQSFPPSLVHLPVLFQMKNSVLLSRQAMWVLQHEQQRRQGSEPRLISCDLETFVWRPCMHAADGLPELNVLLIRWSLMQPGIYTYTYMHTQCWWSAFHNNDRIEIFKIHQAFSIWRVSSSYRYESMNPK